MLESVLRLGVRNLLLHKLRSFLTMLGTILGVASVIAMLAVGEGSKRHAVEQIRKLGASNVIVRSVKPQQRNDDPASSQSTTKQSRVSRVLDYGLKYDDWRLLEKAVPTADRIVPLVLLHKTAQIGGRRITNARVLGTTPQFGELKRIQIQRGRFLRSDDLESSANVVVLGPGAARKLFGYQDPLRRSVLIGRGVYRVIGVVRPEPSATSAPGGVGIDDLNDEFYLPLTAARNRFGELQRIERAGGRDYHRIQLSEITISVEDEELVGETAGMVRQLLSQAHPAKLDYEVQVPLELLHQAESEKRVWNLVLGSIAGISLLVGGIGIMNIMLATVTERTREIGIRRALGARRKDIIAQFLAETTVLTTLGGMIGIVFGLAIPWAVTRAFRIETAVTWWSVMLAFLISVCTGVIFGVYPARRAAHMDPIEALRHQ